MALETTKGPYTVLKLCELCSSNAEKLDQTFYPASVNFAFCLVARVSDWNSAKLCPVKII